MHRNEATTTNHMEGGMAGAEEEEEIGPPLNEFDQASGQLCKF